MYKILILFAIIGTVLFSADYAYSQEVGLATFQETAQVIIDKSISQNVTASVTLQSTSIQEIRITPELEAKIIEDDRILSIVLTNHDQCVLGVFDESCIMINVKRDPTDKDIIEIQDSTKEIGDLFIGSLNEIFDTKAEFHSSFIHTDDESNKALDTSGSISGRGVISAVYTMTMEATDSMYEKISAILIPKTIRESGGFYEVAKSLSSHENAKTTFSIIPLENQSLMQLKLSTNYPEIASSINKVSPLEYLKTEKLNRSEYFSSGFYPLNSIFQVAVLSPESTNVSDIQGDIVPTQIIDDEKIPIEITKKGWIFDPEEGQRIQGKYIFGEELSVGKDELIFSLGGSELIKPKEETFDESIIVVGIIVVIAIGAAMFYLKGYKK